VNRLILASTSRYRADLLAQLQLPFEQLDPGYDEIKQEDESPDSCAIRLAQGKASALANQQDALIIGSDQVAHMGERRLSKPGSYEKAFQQLLMCSGKWLSFSTAVCVLRTADGHMLSRVERFDVRFRQLTPGEIDRYLELDQPFDCAGSFKAESLGISLFSAMRGIDINALYGLPLITLTDLLRHQGLNPLA